MQRQTSSEASCPAKTNLLNAPTAGSTDGRLPTRTIQGWWHLLLLWGFWFMVSNAFNTWLFLLTWTTQPHLSLRKLTVDSVKAHKCNYPLTLLLIIEDCSCCLFFFPEVFTWGNQLLLCVIPCTAKTLYPFYILLTFLIDSSLFHLMCLALI